MRCKLRVYMGCALMSVISIGWLSSLYLRSTGSPLDYTSSSVQHMQENHIPQNTDHNWRKFAPSHLTDGPIIKEIAGDLGQTLSALLKLQRNNQSPALRHDLEAPISQLRQVLNKISVTRKDEVTNTSLIYGHSDEVIPKDVCPENFTSKDLSGGYPFFYKGFNMLNCTDVPPFPAIVTAVFNFVNSTLLTTAKMAAMLKRVNEEYSNLPMLVAAADGDYEQLRLLVKSAQVTIIKSSPRKADMDTWQSLIDKVTTRYVFVARNVVHFSWHGRLERLVREIKGLQASVVAGSYRYMSGVWNYGCEQTTLKNYTLVYTKGYDWSRHECMVCDSVGGPFVAESITFQQHSLPSAMGDVSGFEVWYQELKRNNKHVVSCPDSMFFVNNARTGYKESWIDLARHYQVELIKVSSTVQFSFSCLEAEIVCDRESGIALSHCCLLDLSDMVKTFFRLCKEAGCLCEMQEGTLLGAVKFNGILPWERDADVTFHTANFTAIENLSKKFKKYGYILSTNKEPWCCVDGRKAGGVFNLVSSSWNMEIYGQHLMDSEKLLLEHISPTQVEMDGELIASPASPGLFSRNRYGYEIYQHAQHWMTLSQTSGWAFYKPNRFSECPKPDHHACLDQYSTDGNIQFRSAHP